MSEQNVNCFFVPVRIRSVGEMHIEPLCVPECKCIANISDFDGIDCVNEWHIEHIGHA